MKKALTPWDYGFELASEPKLEENSFNVDGSKCNECPVKAACLLGKYHCESMCFEGLQKMLIQTDVCKKVHSKEDVSKEEAALHLYIDSMLTNLNRLSDAETVPLSFFALWDIRTDCASDETRGGILTAKHAVVCRLLGRQVIEKLRERGYQI